MVRPTKPKEMKPKTDSSAPVTQGAAEAGGIDGNRLILVNAVTTVLICILFIGANYFMQDNLLSNKLKTAVSAGDGENADSQDSSADSGDQEAEQKGIILDLGDFILNLSDVKPRRYLKVNVALELTKLGTDPDPAAAGGGGEGEGKAVDPAKVIEQEMAQYKPAIRDAVISTMSSKTADELSSVAGKELAKEQIQESVNGIFNGEREVLRVSFGNFIIQ